MGIKLIFTIIFVLFLISLLFFYFLPFNTINFIAKPGNHNFSVIQGENQMQFYPNMRFPNPEISYRISECPLQKENDMESAFEIIENITPLRFYSVKSQEEIYITCEERNKLRDGLFIAGEGGPTNITVAGQFNVITRGEISLIKQSECQNPNIAIHELLHVLGFDHSTNQENIMYAITKCNQVIGGDMIDLINQLYSIPSYSDLEFGDVSAILKGRFLDINFSVSNAGLNYAGQSRVIIYGDGEIIKEIDLIPLEIGTGRFISMKNIWVSQVSVNELELAIDSNYGELNKENNLIKLEVS